MQAWFRLVLRCVLTNTFGDALGEYSTRLVCLSIHSIFVILFVGVGCELFFYASIPPLGCTLSAVYTVVRCAEAHERLRGNTLGSTVLCVCVCVSGCGYVGGYLLCVLGLAHCISPYGKAPVRMSHGSKQNF